jgi:Bacteriophage clamp loader A subunit
MADLFKEILPSILQTKENALLTELDERQYPAFMVNRALSYHRDTALIANEMNKYPNLDNIMKYNFLLNIVRAKKRPYNQWHKKVQQDDLSAVKEYYGYSDAKAMEALEILNEVQIKEIKKKINKGT